MITVQDNTASSSYSGGARSLTAPESWKSKKVNFVLMEPTNGGGLGVGASARPARLMIGKEVWIHDNKATDGGGFTDRIQ